jgi:hypothetical protein
VRGNVYHSTTRARFLQHFCARSETRKMGRIILTLTFGPIN